MLYNPHIVFIKFEKTNKTTKIPPNTFLKNIHTYMNFLLLCPIHQNYLSTLIITWSNIKEESLYKQKILNYHWIMLYSPPLVFISFQKRIKLPKYLKTHSSSTYIHIRISSCYAHSKLHCHTYHNLFIYRWRVIL